MPLPLQTSFRKPLSVWIDKKGVFDLIYKTLQKHLPHCVFGVLCIHLQRGKADLMHFNMNRKRNEDIETALHIFNFSRVNESMKAQTAGGAAVLSTVPNTEALLSVYDHGSQICNLVPQFSIQFAEQTL